MKSISQFVAVSLMPAVVSGCMCMMPMDDKSMKKKEDTGMMKMDERGSGMPMTDQRPISRLAIKESNWNGDLWVLRQVKGYDPKFKADEQGG